MTEAASNEDQIYELFMNDPEYRPLKRRIDVLCDDAKDNDDGVIVIVGPEGAGKSFLETQVGVYLSRKLKMPWSIKNLHFDGYSYMEHSLTSQKFSITCLDESRRALNKMRGSSNMVQDFMNFLSECRSQNQLHIILLPAFSDLDRYVAIHRVKLLVSVTKKRLKNGKLLRGDYQIWNTSNKDLLEKAWEAKYKGFPKKSLVAKGKFKPIFGLDSEEYETKKTEAKKERYLEQEKKGVSFSNADLEIVKSMFDYFKNYPTIVTSLKKVDGSSISMTSFNKVKDKLWKEQEDFGEFKVV